MKHIVDTAWKGKMKFEVNIDGHSLVLDAETEAGGEDSGPRPKKLMLVALAGCTGMDVVSLLKKMHVNIEDFNVIVEGDLTEEHPKHYTRMHIIYKFKGKKLDPDKLMKAVEMSQDRYCGVSATLKKAVELTYEIQIEE